MHTAPAGQHALQVVQSKVQAPPGRRVSQTNSVAQGSLSLHASPTLPGTGLTSAAHVARTQKARALTCQRSCRQGYHAIAPRGTVRFMRCSVLLILLVACKSDPPPPPVALPPPPTVVAVPEPASVPTSVATPSTPAPRPKVVPPAPAKPPAKVPAQAAAAPAPVAPSAVTATEPERKVEGPVKFLDESVKKEHEDAMDGMMGDQKSKAKKKLGK